LLLLDDKIYEETKNIVLGINEQSPMVKEFSDWFMRTLSVKILNIQFVKLRSTKSYRLYIIFAETDQYNKMYIKPLIQPNENYQMLIKNEFTKLIIKYHITDIVKLNKIFITYNDFSEEAKTAANWSATNEVKTYIKSRYSFVWDVFTRYSDTTIFYYLENDVITYEKNGISKEIEKEYYKIVKTYDELNYYTRENIRLIFHSKEYLDKHYDGNMFYYYNG